MDRLANNHEALARRGTGPYFYLPKIESHLEARLCNEVFIAAQDALGMPRGTIKATVGALSGSARARVVRPLPWTENFESYMEKEAPPGWVNLTAGRMSVVTLDGSKVLFKEPNDTLLKRIRVFVGPTNWSNYTFEADVRAAERRRQLGDIGITAQRYSLILYGTTQKLKIEPWEPETARTVTADFAPPVMGRAVFDHVSVTGTGVSESLWRGDDVRRPRLDLPGGQFVEVESLILGDDMFDAGDRRTEPRRRAGGDQDVARTDRFSRGDEAHGVRVLQYGAALGELDAGALECGDIGEFKPRDLPVLVGDECPPVEPRFVQRPAVAGGVLELVGKAGGIDE